MHTDPTQKVEDGEKREPKEQISGFHSLIDTWGMKFQNQHHLHRNYLFITVS